MWEGVRSAIFDTIVDSLGGLPSGVGEDPNAEDNPTMQGLYH